MATAGLFLVTGAEATEKKDADKGVEAAKIETPPSDVPPPAEKIKIKAAPAQINTQSRAVDFARDVYPLFQRACFECHGAVKHKGSLRLDQRADALKGGESEKTIVAGKPDDSEIMRRVLLSRDDEETMPPHGAALSKRELKTLREWIAGGAVWPENMKAVKHWAYVKPVRPAVPALPEWSADLKKRWSANAVDAFIAALLVEEGLQPSPEAGRATLVRRLSFDLTGLPPSPELVASFVNGHAPEAYEQLVDKLLASEEFGVKWARPWLDLARYADSHGFQRDDLREVWAYRDWVVRALNADMPFDQFTIEQVAGDLLPDATQDQIIATGFHRCTPTNVEAGTEPEESRINQVIDRVNTTGAVWLGSTIECAQCHNHKYDPFTQRDYYGLLAYFNNTDKEADRSNPKVPGSIRFLGPSMKLANATKDAEREKLNAEMQKLEKQIAGLKPPAGLKTKSAEKSITANVAVLKVAGFSAESGGEGETQPDGSVLLLGSAPDTDTYTVELQVAGRHLSALKLEALTHPSLPGQGPGRGDEMRPNFVLNEFEAELTSAGGAAKKIKFSDAHASFSQAKYDVAQAVDGNLKTAWAIGPSFHRSHEALLELAEPCDVPDGSVLKVRMVQNFGTGRIIGCFRISGVFGTVTDDLHPDVVTAGDGEKPAKGRVKNANDAQLTNLERQKVRMQKQLDALEADSTLVMKELPAPRMTSIFQRGEYTQPGDAVTAATPAVLVPAAEGTPNRLTLARWLVSRENPLTARVTVNRWWAELFGHGIVTTVEDFGIKGEPPTHPELLEWLAVEFMEKGWSMKKVIKTIVMSAAYRQSSHVNEELFALDDRNLLYARGPRLRLDAEAVRDNALSIAGLLSLGKGGPPIRPPQPDGLWKKVGGQQYEYKTSTGEQLHRRGLYVVLKRGAPYPSFVNFDASARLACVVKRSRSNTPLQSLTLLNDPVYVEAAMGFAKRLLLEKQNATLPERIAHAFHIALARDATADELRVLRGLYEKQLVHMTKDATATKQLTGAFSVPDRTSPAEFAAWYAVTTALLNLDETITKN